MLIENTNKKNNNPYLKGYATLAFIVARCDGQLALNRAHMITALHSLYELFDNTKIWNRHEFFCLYQNEIRLWSLRPEWFEEHVTAPLGCLSIKDGFVHVSKEILDWSQSGFYERAPELLSYLAEEEMESLDEFLNEHLGLSDDDLEGRVLVQFPASSMPNGAWLDWGQLIASSVHWELTAPGFRTELLSFVLPTISALGRTE